MQIITEMNDFQILLSQTQCQIAYLILLKKIIELFVKLFATVHQT